GKRQMLPRPTAEPIAAKMKAVRPEKAPRFARRVAPGGGGWVDALKVRLRGSAVGRQLGVTTARWGTRGGGRGAGRCRWGVRRRIRPLVGPSVRITQGRRVLAPPRMPGAARPTGSPRRAAL